MKSSHCWMRSRKLIIYLYSHSLKIDNRIWLHSKWTNTEDIEFQRQIQKWDSSFSVWTAMIFDYYLYQSFGVFAIFLHLIRKFPSKLRHEEALCWIWPLTTYVFLFFQVSTELFMNSVIIDLVFFYHSEFCRFVLSLFSSRHVDFFSLPPFIFFLDSRDSIDLLQYLSMSMVWLVGNENESSGHCEVKHVGKSLFEISLFFYCLVKSFFLDARQTTTVVAFMPSHEIDFILKCCFVTIFSDVGWQPDVLDFFFVVTGS